MLPPGFAPSDVHRERFQVELDYPVVFLRAALRPSASELAWAVARDAPARRHPVFAVLDAGLVSAQPALPGALAAYVAEHAETLELRGEPFVMPGGEAAKNDPSLFDALKRALADARLDRHATVVVIGGGAVLDAAGFAASITHRGLRCLRLPSTVLAQCDGGVGVKTGVNAFGAKNLFGTFAPPWAVLDDFDLLATLPLRDARAGMAEAVKVALIRDAALFAWLETHADALSRGEPDPVEALVRRTAVLHLEHIARGGDPFESGSARPLDYGHWAAHRLEILSGHELRHGEAVAIGMLLDARYAERKGLLAGADLERLARLLERLGLPLGHAALGARTGRKLDLLRGLEDFREHLGGELSVTLLTAIGRSEEVHAMDPALVEEAIAWLGERAGSP